MNLKHLIIMGLIVYGSVYILCRIYIKHQADKNIILKGENNEL